MSGVHDTTKRQSSSAPRGEPRTSLVFYHRDGAKIVVPSATPVVVGRSAPADVVLDDPSVSRSHARFFLAGDGSVAFEDLGSTNGTRLNGAPAPRGKIAGGDEVRLGDVTVALHVLSVVPGSSGLLGYDVCGRLLEDELVRARTFARPAALLMVAARAPGHALPAWAPSLLEKLRPVDRAAVYASDAVLVMLPEARREHAEALGASIVEGGSLLRFGVATFPENGTTQDELLAAARAAMVRGPSRAGPLREAALVVGERMKPVRELVTQVAGSSLPVLIVGETGVGKEVVARTLHARSPRADGPLRSVNCAAIPANLVESVLFGQEKGAFAGEGRTTKGLFEQAHGGTLLLDEVAELPAPVQAALLRVLDTKRLTRVGADREIAVDVRVVAATHRDLERMCQEGTFRADLFYRLHGVTVDVPPLRERRDEIRPLAELFVREACRENGRLLRGIDGAALAALQAWSWPGNIRELKNVMERAVVIARGELVAAADLPERIRAGRPQGPGTAPLDRSNAAPTLAPPPPGGSAETAIAARAPSASDEDADYKERLRREMHRYETQLILDALARANGSVTAAAQALRIPVRTLTHKMQALGIRKRFDGGTE